MGPKRLNDDSAGFMVNIGIVVIMGYCLVAMASLAFWFHRMGWAEDGWLAAIWSFAPFIFALGVMIISSRVTMDPKFIIIAGVVGAAFYYIFFVLG